MRIDSVIELIGNTPLLRIHPDIHRLHNIDLYAKLELFNPFGSVKDRIAWNIIQPDLDGIRLEERTLIELSSGNTAKALALLGSMHGVSMKTVTNRIKAPEMKRLLLLLGAQIEELPGQSECLDPADTTDPLSQIYRDLSAGDSSYFHTDQYFNPRNTQAHVFGTGAEIVTDLDGQVPDYFIAGVGTSGSSTGTALVLRKYNPDVEVIGIISHKSDFIPGIRNVDEVHEVGLFDPSNYDVIEAVTSAEAIDGMMTLIRRCGVLSGPTGGAAYFGAVRRLRTIDATLAARQTAVFIVCDRVESYLSYLQQRRPELFQEPPRRNSVDVLSRDEITAIPAMGVQEAQGWIEEIQPLVIDLRGPFAFAALHIENSVNIVDELFGELVAGGLPVGSRQPVLLVCPVGEKSRQYAALLARMGHQDARSLDGGVVAWRDAGAPLVGY